MLAEDLAMFSFLMESIVISFTLGGVVGAVVAIHFLYPRKESIELPEREGESIEGQAVLQREIGSRLRIPPRR